jgi:hypothetical protein
MIFLPVERTMIAMTLAVTSACVFLSWYKDIVIDPLQSWFPFVFAAALIGVGQIYRRYRNSERIALTANSLAVFVAYSVWASMLITLLLPRPAAPIDATLVRIDAWLGYSWPEACAWISNYPTLSDVLRKLYSLTLAQLLFTFMFLGMANNPRRLLVMALATMLASLVTIFSWAYFPSAGASAYWTLSPEINRIVRPVVDSAYGAEVNRLLAEGVTNVATLKTTGLIGFPSFHTVMVLISLFGVWPYRLLRYPLIVVTALMVPAILIHGGHNLCDVLGGAAITMVCWYLARLIYDAKECERLPLPVPGPEHVPA